MTELEQLKADIAYLMHRIVEAAHDGSIVSSDDILHDDIRLILAAKNTDQQSE
jgi:hypothetical protein